MSPRAGALALAVWVVLGGPGSAAAAEPMEVHELLRVEVATLDFVAVDRGGRPVGDLRLEELELYEEGRRAELIELQGPAAVGTVDEGAPGGSPPAPAARDRDAGLVVLYVDQRHISPDHRSRVMAAARDFVERRLAAGDRIAVAVDRGALAVPLPPTRRPEAIAAALDEVEADIAGGPQILSDRRTALDSMKSLLDVRGCENADSLRDVALSYGRRRANEITAALHHLGEFIGSLRGIPGRRVLVHVSDGLPLVPGQDLLMLVDEWCEGVDGNESRYGMVTGAVSYRASRRLAGELSLADKVEKVADLAAAAGVLMYPLEASGRGGRHGGEGLAQIQRMGSTFLEATARSGDQDVLAALAAPTGGQALLGVGDPGRAFGRLEGDLAGTYRLWFRPPRKVKDGAPHRLELKIRRRGVRLRYRRVNRDVSPREKVMQQVLAALWTGDVVNDLGVSLFIERLEEEAQEERETYAVSVSIPYQKLLALPTGSDEEVRVGLYVAPEYASGRKLVPRYVPLRKVYGPATGVAPGVPFTYRFKVQLPPGNNRLALALVDEIGVGRAVLLVTIEVAPRRPTSEPG